MPDIFVSKNKKKKNLPSYSFRFERKPKKKTAMGKIVGKKRKVSSRSAFKYPKNHAEREKLPGHTHNPLASFCHFPDRVSFVNQDKEEKVILLLRHHPITNIGWIVTGLFLILAPPIISVFTFFESMPVQFQIVFAMVWYLMTTAYVFERFLSWYFHVNIVTDERIIEVDFIHLVYREITDCDIDLIQEVTVEMSGAVRTSFNFGDVDIQTAAQVSRVKFEAVPKPDMVARVLRDLRIEEEVEKLEGRVR